MELTVSGEKLLEKVNNLFRLPFPDNFGTSVGIFRFCPVRIGASFVLRMEIEAVQMERPPPSWHDIRVLKKLLYRARSKKNSDQFLKIVRIMIWCQYTFAVQFEFWTFRCRFLSGMRSMLIP